MSPMRLLRPSMLRNRFFVTVTSSEIHMQPMRLCWSGPVHLPSFDLTCAQYPQQHEVHALFSTLFHLPRYTNINIVIEGVLTSNMPPPSILSISCLRCASFGLQCCVIDFTSPFPCPKSICNQCNVAGLDQCIFPPSIRLALNTFLLYLLLSLTSSPLAIILTDIVIIIDSQLLPTNRHHHHQHHHRYFVR